MCFVELGVCDDVLCALMCWTEEGGWRPLSTERRRGAWYELFTLCTDVVSGGRYALDELEPVFLLTCLSMCSAEPERGRSTNGTGERSPSGLFFFVGFSCQPTAKILQAFFPFLRVFSLRGSCPVWVLLTIVSSPD